MSERSWLLAPRWLLAHLLVLALAAGLAGLGVWQLRRLGEMRAVNARIAERVADEPVPFEQVADLEPDDAQGLDDLEFQPVTVTGTYRPAERVLQRSRSHRGRNGWHVLTPLSTGDGHAVLVRRGWVPFDVGDEGRVDAVAGPPGGPVTVTGYLEVSDQQPGFGPRDPAAGRLDTVFHADVSRIDRQTAPDLHPMVLHLRSQQPPQPGELPIPAAVPERDTGRHLSYAVQWFSFAAIALGGYGTFLWRRREPTGDPASARAGSAGG